MIEKSKSIILGALVVLSLIQSYLLAYSMPGLGVTVSPQQDYVKTEPMGAELKIENVIFPEDMVLHMGKNKHTILYPGMNFYNQIYEKIQSREFKGFEAQRTYSIDWEDVRDKDQGLELRFGHGIPVELLMKTMKLEGDLQFLNDSISRIWIYKLEGRDEVRTYFFSNDGTTVYESVRADLTTQDLLTYVGFGEYLPVYMPVDDHLYAPVEAVEGMQSLVGYELYTPEQMQHNLFFDPNVTRVISDKSGSQIYTDGKRGLQVEQNGRWISYTDPVAGPGNEEKASENISASVLFINEHGGWDGRNLLEHAQRLEDGQVIRYQQYYSTPYFGALPIVPQAPFLFGEIRMRVQHGVVSEYERSLMTLNKSAKSKVSQWLPGGAMLTDALRAYGRRSEVIALYPALRAFPMDEHMLRLEPVWAVRLEDGTQDVLMQALPAGYTPLEKRHGGAAANADGSGAGLAAGAASDGAGADGQAAKPGNAGGAGAGSGASVGAKRVDAKQGAASAKQAALPAWVGSELQQKLLAGAGPGGGAAAANEQAAVHGSTAREADGGAAETASGTDAGLSSEDSSAQQSSLPGSGASTERSGLPGGGEYEAVGADQAQPDESGAASVTAR